jgi:hypothetical protein
MEYSALTLKQIKKLPEYKKLDKKYNKSKLKKEDLVKVLYKISNNENKKQVLLLDKKNVKFITPITKMKKESRRARIKSINMGKKSNRKIAKILYRDIPSLKTFKEKRKTLNKREPLYYIKYARKCTRPIIYYDENGVQIKYTLVNLDNDDILAQVNDKTKLFKNETNVDNIYNAKKWIVDNIKSIFEENNIN